MQRASGAVIVNERLKGNPTFLANCSFLQNAEVKFSTGVPFDLCFNVQGQPSIFVALWGPKETLPDVIARLSKMQAMSKTSFAVGGAVSGQAWTALNNALPRGSLRLLRTSGDSNTVFPLIIASIVKDMSNTQKLDLQTEFFRKSERFLESREKARDVLGQVFARLQVPDQDGLLVLESLGQIRHVVTAQLDFLTDNVPADINSLAAVSGFFSMPYTLAQQTD